MHSEKEKIQLKNLDKIIGMVVLISGVSVLFYILNFSKNEISSDPADWGVFGDYLGGTINPILGFFSFMLLLLNLHLQRKQLDKTEEQLDLNREELRLTRDELKKAADAQVDSTRIMSEQLKTQTFQQSDNLFSVMFKQILDCQKDVVEECERRRYYSNRSNRNLQSLRYAIKSKNIFKKYFRLLFQTFSMLDEILEKKDKDKLNQYIKVIRSQQEDIVLELLFVYISENRETPSEFHRYLKSSNFFKHITLDIETLKFPEVLRAYEEFDFVNKIEFFKKTNN